MIFTPINEIMKKDVEVIKDPDKLRISLEKTRSQILALLSVNEMTISQISEALNKDQSTIYRHVKKLEEADLVEVCGEKRQHHIPERVYGRTADVFIPSIEPMEKGNPSAVWITWKKDHCDEIIDHLTEVGYKIDNEEEIKGELNDFLTYLNNHISEILNSGNDDLQNSNFFTILRLKMMILLIELVKNDELDDKLIDIIENFKFVD